MRYLVLGLLMMIPVLGWTMAEKPPVPFIVEKDSLILGEVKDFQFMQARVCYLAGKFPLEKIDLIILRDNKKVKKVVLKKFGKEKNDIYGYSVTNFEDFPSRSYEAIFYVKNDKIVGCSYNTYTK